MARLLFRAALATALVLLPLLLLSPWLLYEVGLRGIEGRPSPPAVIAAAEQQAVVWRHARGGGLPEVEPMNPYGFVMGFLAHNGELRPGETLAYWVAREHLLAQSRRWGMARWHLSNAALAIWLTRHWSAAELATAALAVVERDLEARSRRRSPATP